MDLCEIGLQDIIVARGSLSESETKKIMHQLIKALIHCHSNDIIHRDIKPQNIMIVNFTRQANEFAQESINGEKSSNHSDNAEEYDWHIKLIDWGIACKSKKNSKLSEKCGSPLYMAPEVIQGLYDNKCDVWSCGVLMYFMLTGMHPFNGLGMKELFWDIKFTVLDFEKEFWSRFSPQCVSFLK
jgi:calcium-dependent protein kinase